MQSLLTCVVGDMTFAVPIAAVERILRMAALSPVPHPTPGVVGLLNVAGAVLPVVDPRPMLGASPAPADPSQFLVLLRAEDRYLLWVDEVGQMVDAALFPSPSPGGPTLDMVAQIEGRVVPIVDPSLLDPARADAEVAEATR